MESNPYQPPDSQAPATATDSGSTSPLIYVLCAFVGVQIIVSIGLTLLNLLGGVGAGLIGGIVSTGFYIAMLVGLLMKQEWARVCLIWFCYVSLVFLAMQLSAAAWLVIPMMCMQVATLIFSHSGPVRRSTQEHSVAKTYTYVDSEL